MKRLIVNTLATLLFIGFIVAQVAMMSVVSGATQNVVAVACGVVDYGLFGVLRELWACD